MRHCVRMHTLSLLAGPLPSPRRELLSVSVVGQWAVAVVVGQWVVAVGMWWAWEEVCSCPPNLNQNYNLRHSRDERVSALCLFSHRGFEDWRFTLGTYNADVFDEAMEEMLFKPRPGGLGPLLHDFPVILMDNAKIHTAAFEHKVHMASGGRTRVMRIPPYLAPKLSPLDNGGFGLSA